MQAVKSIVVLIGGMLMIVRLGGCSEEEMTLDPQAPFEIVRVNLQDKWNPRASRTYRIEAQVSHPKGPEALDHVSMTVRRDTDGPIVFSDSLFDDGAWFRPDDGDVIARDGFFSNRFSTAEIDSPLQSGAYYLSFQAIDAGGMVTEAVAETISVGNNSAPVVTDIRVPDKMSPTDAGIVVTAAAADSNGAADIIRVFFTSQPVSGGSPVFERQLYDDGNTDLNGDMTAGDGIYSVRLDSSFRAGKSGDYRLVFYAEDSFSQISSQDTSAVIAIENGPSGLGGINVPSTLALPTDGETYSRGFLTVRVTDPEGLADIDSVYFFSLKPDSTLANNGRPIELVDNGRPFSDGNPGEETGDVEAGDGIYSFSLLVFPNTDTGIYVFSFYVRDRGGNLTGPEERQVSIVE